MEIIAIAGCERNADGTMVLRRAAVLDPMSPMTIESADSSAIPTARKQVEAPKRKANKPSADRFGVLNAFVDSSMAGLTKSEIATWLVLYRDTRNGSVAISQANIARRAGVSDRAVRLAISKLVKVGLLQVLSQGGLNRGVSRYRVHGMLTK